MKRLALIGCAGLAIAACSSLGSAELDSAQAEAAARQFYQLISSYDYDGLRAASSQDFEILEGGRRMDIDDFVSMLEGMEARGIKLSFEATDFNTEISGDVAYTTNRMVSGGGTAYLEAFIFRRTDSGWRADRVFSTRATDVGPQGSAG